MDTPRSNTVPHQNKIAQLEAALALVIADVCRRGFYGTAGVVLNIQDGRIQHIRITTDRMMK